MAWDHDKVFITFGEASRRRIIISLAVEGQQSGAQLAAKIDKTVDTTLKQVGLLCDAGMVEKLNNSADRRIPLYRLTPKISVTKTDQGAEIDFGFWLLRLAKDDSDTATGVYRVI